MARRSLLTKPELLEQADFDESADTISRRMMHGHTAVTAHDIYPEYACAATIKLKKYSQIFLIEVSSIKVCRTNDPEFEWKKGESDWPYHDGIEWVVSASFTVEITIEPRDLGGCRAILTIESDPQFWIPSSVRYDIRYNGKKVDEELPLILGRNYTKNLWRYFLSRSKEEPAPQQPQQPPTEETQPAKRGPNAATEVALKNLITIRNEKRDSRTGKVTIAFYKACELSNVRADTIKRNYPELHKRWDDANYWPAPSEFEQHDD